jgi:hypothetical protein
LKEIKKRLNPSLSLFYLTLYPSPEGEGLNMFIINVLLLPPSLSGEGGMGDEVIDNGEGGMGMR